mgnify:CR=1 FL=1
MDVEFHADIYSDEASVRYWVSKEGSRNEDEINLTQVERIDDISGIGVLHLPTCASIGIMESWSRLDRRIYDALVSAGMLQVTVSEIEVELNGGYSRPPTVSFECKVAGSNDIVKGFINPLRIEDTPDMPLFIWEAVAKEARGIVNRFVESFQKVGKGEVQQ